MSDEFEYLKEDYFSHFTSELSQEIVNYCTEEAFRFSRYIFTKRVGKQQYGYCTHCRKEFKTKGLRHNEKAFCPECNSTCTVKSSGMGRKRLVDEVFFIYYEKSIKDPKVIVAKGIYAIRDYRFNYHNVETLYKVSALYVFEPGNPRMLKRYVGFSHYYGNCWVGGWQKCSSVYSMFTHDHIKNIQTACSKKSIEEAVKVTSFSWSGWESYYNHFDDLVTFFELYCKYPSIEYLTKLGFSELVKGKLNGHPTYRAINWRGKSLFKVLKISKQDLNEIKKQKIDVDFKLLRLMQLSKKDGSNISPTEAAEIEKEFKYNYYIDELAKVLAYSGFRKTINYLRKQCEKLSKQYRDIHSALLVYRDYLSDCKKLEWDLTREYVLYPNNLYKAHQNTIKQVKVKSDKILDKNIRVRGKALEKYRFELNGLMIIPAMSSKELIDEGKELDHCVGTYADRYAKGQTSIFFIRKINQPNKPYYTVEVIKDRVTQVRGKKNCSPTNKVEKFVEAFKVERLNQQNTNNKERIAIPA